MLLYLIQVSVCLTAFYGIYYLLFRRFSFFRLNRFYLLGSLILSFLIPQIRFKKEVFVSLNPQPEIQDNYIQEAADNQTFNQLNNHQMTIEKTSSFWDRIDWLLIIEWMYFSVVAILTIRFIFMVSQILKLRQKAQKVGKFWLIETESNLGNASFFNIVLLNTQKLVESERQQIIAHECTHTQLGHSFDRILVEFSKIVLWFNPVIYLYKNSLNQVHEYEVDALMIQHFDTKQYANLLLKLGTNSHKPLIIHQFSTHPLKDRINFMLTKPTSNMKKLFYFLTIPMVAIGVVVFAKETTKIVYQTSPKTIKEFVQPESIPLKVFTTNDNMKNTPLYNFTEKNLSLNELYTLPNAVYYVANPNFFTLETVNEINNHIVKKGFRIIVEESQKNINGELSKIKLAVKNQKNNKISKSETIDMIHARETGKKGGIIGLNIFNNHFNDSGFYLVEGNADLIVYQGKNSGFNNSKASNLVFLDNQITYYVSPDRVKKSTFEGVANHFKNAGFDLSISDIQTDERNNIKTLRISLKNGSETKNQTFDLDKLRHIVQYKNEKPSNWDETIVVSGNLKTN
jgi:hypothetical protein